MENITVEFILENLKKIAPWDLPDLIIATNEIEKCLDKPEILENLNPWDLTDLIIGTNKIEKFLGKPLILESLYVDCLIELIVKTNKIVNFLEKTEILEKLNSGYITNLIKESNEVERCLENSEILKRLEPLDLSRLIVITNKISEYLEKPEILERLTGNCKVKLIKRTNEIHKYLAKEKIKELKLQSEDIAEIIGIEKKMISKIPQLIEEGKLENFGSIFKGLANTNSSRLNRVKQQISLQLCEMDSENIKSEIQQIKNIYETTDLPEFAQNFLVFKTLHPRFMGNEESLTKDVSSVSQIPSLNVVTPEQRSRIIFSDLLKINIESNNRNLKSYLTVIEQGDKLFNLVKKGKLHVNESMPEKDIELLAKYRDILNTLYNQTSEGKRAQVKRKNTGDIEKDLLNLDKLLSSMVNGKINLPDRIVRMFGHSIGVRTLKQAKKIMEEVVSKTNKRNQDNAKQCNITLEEGDFVKGIASDYLPKMLQAGIVAKDYLGQYADHDCTPCDTDVEMIEETGVTFIETYNMLKTAPSYVGNGNLGKVLLVFENSESFINTRTSERC